jgi:DNA helicase MCM9
MIHEAMEQQTVHVAKAGMVTTLSTRTTVIGATNPKGAYDPLQPLGGAASLSSPLLSRFDIVLLLRDCRLPAWDQVVSSQVLANHAQHADEDAEEVSMGEAAGSDVGAQIDQSQPRSQQQSQPGQGQGQGSGWTIDMLQKYVVWAKASFQPSLTAEAEAVLVAYYQSLRQAADRSAARTTIRMLESLVRVAQVRCVSRYHACMHACMLLLHHWLLQRQLVWHGSQPGLVHLHGCTSALATQHPSAAIRVTYTSICQSVNEHVCR